MDCIYTPIQDTDPIKELQLKHLALREHVNRKKEALDTIKLMYVKDIEDKAAELAAKSPSDKSLSNQTRRDAAVNELLLADDDYRVLDEEVTKGTSALAMMQIDLAYLERQYKEANQSAYMLNELVQSLLDIGHALKEKR